MEPPRRAPVRLPLRKNRQAKKWTTAAKAAKKTYSKLTGRPPCPSNARIHLRTGERTRARPSGGIRFSAAACLSPNDSVRSLKQRRGNRHASRAGCLEVDDELVMRQTLHGECARLSAFEDLVNVRGQSPPGLGPARAVRDQAHGVPVVPHEECGQPIPDRRFGDTPSMLDGRGHLQDQHGLGLLAASGLEGGVQVGVRSSNPQSLSLEADGPCLLLIPGSGRFRGAGDAPSPRNATRTSPGIASLRTSRWGLISCGSKLV